MQSATSMEVPHSMTPPGLLGVVDPLGIGGIPLQSKLSLSP